MLKDVREYIDRLQIDGHTIGEDHDDDPILIDADGRAVDTWRENYPSWYNRGGVERVMGFASPPEYEQFMAHAPVVERMLVDSGISLTKFWFSVTRAEQRTRFIIRQVDPVRQWKLSPIDLESLDKWDAYTEAKENMIRRTDTKWAPWTTIKSNDKKRARVNAMRAFLSRFDYDGKDDDIVAAPDPRIVQRGKNAVGD